MKRSRAFLLLLVGMIVAAPGPGIAETRTVSWNPPTTYTDNTPFAPGTTVTYDVFWSADPALSAASLRTIASSVAGTSTTFDPDSVGMPRGTIAYVTADAVLNTGAKSDLATAFAWNVPTVASLSIAGPSSVNENGSAAYAATATWSDGSTSPVTPVWSENSSYASISAGGVLTAGSVPSTQAVTVTASYTSGAVTRTASASVAIVDVPATLSSLSIAGPSSVNENGSATYAATATWSDGSTSSVTPVWSENSSYASISAGGVLTAGPVPATQAVTVSASYTGGGVTRTASASLAILDVPPTLSSLSIAGPSSVNESGSATYAATATWSDGTATTVTAAASWSTTLGTIGGGVLTSPSVTGNQTATVSASYTSTSGPTTTRTAQMTVTIVNVASLSGLTINGPASVNEGDTANYVATATWSDGTSTTVTAVSSWSTTLGTISGGGLTAPSVTASQTATVSATYTGGTGGTTATRTAQLSVTIVDVPATTPAAPENLDVSGPVTTAPATVFRMTWDPVTTYTDGSAIATGGVSYTAYWTTDPALSDGTLQPLASPTSTTSVDFDPAAKGMKRNQRVYLTTRAVDPSGKQSSLGAAVSWRVSNSGPVPPANGRIYKR